jgi:hypothetical protein
MAAGQGMMAPMRPVQMPQIQQAPPAATGAPQQIGQQNRPCYPQQNVYPNSAQQLGAQYGPNQVYPGYQSGMGGMPGGSGIPGLGGTPGMGSGFPGMGGDSGMGGMAGIVGMIAGQALNSHNNAAAPNSTGNGYYGGYAPQPAPNAQYGNGYYGPPTNNPQYGNGYYGGYGSQPAPNAQYGTGYGPSTSNSQYGNGYYGGYGPQANNAAPNSQVPCPPR